MGGGHKECTLRLTLQVCKQKTISKVSNVSCAHNEVNLENWGHKECTLRLTLQVSSRKCHNVSQLIIPELGGIKSALFMPPILKVNFSAMQTDTAIMFQTI